MNIRAITYFANPSFPVSAERLAAAGKVTAEIKAALEAGGYAVQTIRLAAPPFPTILGGEPGQTARFAQDLEAAIFVNRIDVATLGPARPQDAAAFFHAIPDAIGATEHIFAAAIIADPVNGLSLPAVRLAADVIQRCSTVLPDGFGNLRFAALANVPAGSPFLPAGYHDGGSPMVAIGVEAAEVAVSAVANAGSPAEARERLVHAVEDHAQKISGIVKKVGGRRGPRFGGIDFSFAPYPDAARSLGTALEKLSGVSAGQHGTLAAAAFLADALDRAELKRAGFSGLFLPVLEDAVLAARAAEGLLTLNDLLLYSCVCGVGLDTAPLPGDISPEAIAAILADVGALALRLNKPLTARLMPLPGKRAGDEVKFDFPYFAPTRVLDPRSTGLGGLFAAAATFDLAPRSR